jgi:hypothetical protein
VRDQTTDATRAKVLTPEDVAALLTEASLDALVVQLQSAAHDDSAGYEDPNNSWAPTFLLAARVVTALRALVASTRRAALDEAIHWAAMLSKRDDRVDVDELSRKLAELRGTPRPKETP